MRHISRRACAVTGAAALTFVGLAAPTAMAADPVEPGAIDPALTSVNLLNINDFHGRIDDNGTGELGLKFACTLETTKADLGEDSTVFLSAGDNIGASPFTSSSQDDNPTIDYLNALELKASAVGNHEFDKGFSDLTGRVSTRADWDYLGANVYERGTSTPALQEYSIQTVNGLRVAVIGVVTDETPELVTPTGVSGLDFGDPVAAVNRVAAQLSDGEDANGEADVIVAEYHEGATEGVAEDATLEEEVAAGGIFGRIVTETSAEVDAIFTGHTHKQYAWDAPIPGGSGTRPVLQAASYGAFVGQVQLGLDPQTGELGQYSVTNVPLVAAPTEACAADPQYAAAKAVVDQAVATAKPIGEQVIATVADDITTAVKPDGSRDDRLRESSLGNLTAQVWLESMNATGRPGADIGMMNPGSLRAELYYEPTGNEAAGEVTYAEAASINPFANTLQTIDITGAQLRTVLEQQWQPEGASRPFLKLGLSENLTYTFDPDAPAGSRILSVMLDGQPIDPAATYTVASSSFLIAGGDNFTELREGTTMRDSGLIDMDAFVNYLRANSPVAPSFAKHAIAVQDQPAQLTAGETTTFTVSGLDLTSKDAPRNTQVEVFLGERSLGVFPVEEILTEAPPFPTRNGRAEISIDVPEDVAGGDATIRLVAADTGTVSTFPVTVIAAATSTTTTDDDDDEPSSTSTTSDDDTTSTSTSTSGTPTSTATVTGPVVETDDTAPGATPGAVASLLGLLLAGGAAAGTFLVRRRSALRQH